MISRAGRQSFPLWRRRHVRAAFSPGCRVLMALIAGVWLLQVPTAQAAVPQSAGAVRSGARAIAGRIAAQKAAGGFDTAAQQQAVQGLGKLALAYIDLSERVQNAGGARRDRDALRGAYEAVATSLESIYEQNKGALDRMTKKIMDEDGDLEALYDTQPYKNAQLVASQALYFLNWLHYYGAQLYTGAQRQTLLEKAQRGFSEFIGGDQHTPLFVESLLGRGLCNLELGKSDFAVHDLEAVANDPQASPERKEKARLALLDGYVRAGKVVPALKLSQQLLRSGDHADANVVRFLRIRALLAGAKGATGSTAAGYRQEALNLMNRLRRAGPGWEEKVSALLATGIDNPQQWAAKANSPFAKWELAKLLVQKGDYKQAMPLLESFVASRDAEMRRHRQEAQYFLGLAKFQAGQYQEAAEDLDASLQGSKPSYGADAAYMRFKALETLVAKTPNAGAELTTQYERAIRSYLHDYPDHKFAYEAQFRLGELLQAQRKFADAVDAYRKVHGDAGFVLRSRFAVLQCDFELLQVAGNTTPPAQRAALLQDIGDGLRVFDKDAAAYAKHKEAHDQAPVRDMQAKVALMRAVYATLGPQPDDAAVLKALAGFEDTYPKHKDLLPQVVRLRLLAEQHLGRFADAQAEVEKHGAVLIASMQPAEIDDMAMGFIRAGAVAHGKGEQGANTAAEKVAIALYAQQDAAGKGSAKTTVNLARLYENTGKLDKAQALYTQMLHANAKSFAALRGLGRVAAAEKRWPDAIGYWRQLGKASRPGDAPWYEANYEIARVTQEMGKKEQSCALLNQLKPAMPGLSDVDLRKKLDALYKQVCG